MGQLSELVVRGNHLNVAQMAVEVSDALADTTLECRPFTWVPYAPATIDESHTARDGLMAVRGWAIAPKDDKPHRLSMLAALYMYRSEGIPVVPRLVVTSLYQESGSRSLEQLFKQDSEPAHGYRSLQVKQYRYNSNVRFNGNVPDEEVVAYYQQVRAWAKHFYHIGAASDMFQLQYALWDREQPIRRDIFSAPEPLTSERIAQNVNRANALLGLIATSGFPPELIPPEAIDSQAYQSWQTLLTLNTLFKPSTIEPQPPISRWRKRSPIFRAAGAIAKTATVAIGLNDAYHTLRERTDEFYDNALS